MSLKVFIYAYRKPGLSLEEFKKHYKDHVDLVKRLSGEDFPISHKRSYVARNTRNRRRGCQRPQFPDSSHSDCRTAAAFQAFSAKVYVPDAAFQIAADEEKFLDKSRLGSSCSERS
ncbi:EthD domain-containing protein [Penicillium canescens]|uniref:EthD domain-containing protein n=1 Tax=Penicillium canescens TaxID=5083 RepID=A0AAD6I320_PENCN|nr:EthD domain-containing protein [Penicillium canescens]KAJ6060180.1 EthD domain-containing protein [Penicillium canescens]KAJ6063541.1 EthD domain-containing protein [Penicillium canescens]